MGFFSNLFPNLSEAYNHVTANWRDAQQRIRNRLAEQDKAKESATPAPDVKKP